MSFPVFECAEPVYSRVIHNKFELGDPGEILFRISAFLSDFDEKRAPGLR